MLDLENWSNGELLTVAGILVALVVAIPQWVIPFIVARRERHRNELLQEQAAKPVIDKQRNQNWPLTSNLPDRPRDIVGRESDLARLAEMVEDKHVAAVTGHRTNLAVARGPGGIGKTELATEYARLNAKNYEGVWLVPAESEATMFPALKHLAQKLDVPDAPTEKQTAQEALRAAAKRGAPWLILFDNAPDRQAIGDYLIGGETLHCLITSRHADWGDGIASFPVDVLGEADAEKLLRQVSGREGGDFAPVLAALGGYPLALVAAGGWLRTRPNADAPAYLAAFEERLKKDEAEGYKPTENPDVPRSVYHSVSLSIEQLPDDSRHLLSLAAYLSPDDLWREMIGNPGALDPSRSKGAHDWPPFIPRLAEKPALLEEAIAGLERASLLRRVGEGEAERLTLHRLTQAVMRARLGGHGPRWADAAARLVNAYVPHDPRSIVNWETFSRLLPHALIASPKSPPSDASSRLMSQCGSFSMVRGDVTGAIQFDEGALTKCQQVHGARASICVPTMSNLAQAYASQGELIAAEHLAQEAVEIDLFEYGEAPETATDMSVLANIYLLSNRFADAESLLLNILKIDRTHLGDYHPDIARDIGNLGALYSEWGMIFQNFFLLSKAERYMFDACLIAHSARGPMHLDTAIQQESIGIVMARLGDLQSAREKLQQTFIVRLSLLGQSNVLTKKAIDKFCLIGGDYAAIDKEKSIKSIRCAHLEWAFFKLKDIAIRHDVPKNDRLALQHAVVTTAQRLKDGGASEIKWRWPEEEFHAARDTLSRSMTEWGLGARVAEWMAQGSDA